jgi:toxin secretion/phage lysis holin
MNMNKQMICTAVGAVGSFIASIFGGWDTALATLLIFMAVDYITGLLVAGVFHASPKSENGALESKAGFKGLIRKGLVLVVILVACRMDMLLGVNYIRDAACIAFIVNELISMVENFGLMGVPFPEPIKEAIELLQKKGEKQ